MFYSNFSALIFQIQELESNLDDDCYDKKGELNFFYFQIEILLTSLDLGISHLELQIMTHIVSRPLHHE